MPRKSPVTDLLRARVLDLHAKDVGRNEIARLVGLSGRTISNIVKAAGREFDVTITRAATQHRQADLAHLRSSAAFRLIEKVHDLLDDMSGEFLAYNFGGKDNTYEEHTLPRPPADAIRSLMQAVGTATKASLELSKVDADPNEGLPAVDRWLDHMVGDGNDMSPPAGNPDL